MDRLCPDPDEPQPAECPVTDHATAYQEIDRNRAVWRELGLPTAAFALLSVSVVGRLAGLGDVDDRAWLVLALPLWVMVGTSEWFIVRVRHTMAVHLEASESLGRFRAAASRTMVASTAAGGVVLVGAAGIASGTAVVTSDLSLPVAGMAATGFAVIAASVLCVEACRTLLDPATHR